MSNFWDKFKFKRKPKIGAAAKTARPPAAAVSSPVRSKAAEKTGDAPRILEHPLLTEKASRLSGQRQYVFAVALDSTRLSVARAIYSLYGVRPERVNIIRVTGKAVRFGRTSGREKSWKKAMVTLPPGKQITVYEGV